MSKRIILILTVLFSTCLSENLFAQDPLFTQFYANPLYLNPALAGAARCPRINLNYRNQWRNAKLYCLHDTYIEICQQY